MKTFICWTGSPKATIKYSLSRARKIYLCFLKYITRNWSCVYFGLGFCLFLFPHFIGFTNKVCHDISWLAKQSETFPHFFRAKHWLDVFPFYLLPISLCVTNGKLVALFVFAFNCKPIIPRLAKTSNYVFAHCVPKRLGKPNQRL